MTDVRLALDDPVDRVPGVGPKAAAELAEAFGIRTVRDLVWHAPSRTADQGAQVRAAQADDGAPATLVGRITGWDQRVVQRGRRLRIAEATVREPDGAQFRVTFFNQAWRAKQLPPGTVVRVSGKVRRFRGTTQLTNPEVDVIGDADVEVDPSTLDEGERFSTVYPATERLPSWRLRRWILAALDALPPIPEHLPDEILASEGLVSIDVALRDLHRPSDPAVAERASRRLVYDELFVLQVALQWRRARMEAATRGLPSPPRTDRRAQAYLDSLPFDPTSAQVRAFDQVGHDLARERPMHRLLQGDVGAGKTVVAAWTMLCAVDNGRQAALMVPTEVLAEQHHRTLLDQLAPLGVNVLDGPRVALLTGSSTARERDRITSGLLTGEIDVVVGTHALLEEGVRFRDLGVVVVDEQHRFGVAQRVRLIEKGADEEAERARVTGEPARPPRMPHVLVMTATPIPRSLALTLYGDLDVTVLDELPPGRQPVVTTLIPPSEATWRRQRVHDFIRREAAEGGQAYVVCTLVEPSLQVAARSATTEYELLRDEVFPDLAVGIVHGQMSSDDKDAAMTAFRRGELDVLVATTVIEVGVDNPNATVMVIEDAERFGISQLHQLRGRVGRGSRQSYCILFGDPDATPDAKRRLVALTTTSSGFDLAEVDLDVRGQGQLFGRVQSGLGTDLRFASLARDLAVLDRAKEAARVLVAGDRDLAAPRHAELRRAIIRRFRGDNDLAALTTG